jgi:hypothetical protein
MLGWIKNYYHRLKSRFFSQYLPAIYKDLDLVRIQAMLDTIKILQMAPANTAIVAKSGNNTTASIGGGAFQTINEAISAINTAGATGVTILVYPGIYYETIVMPPYTTLVGISLETVIITRQGVTSNTTLVTMGENTSISDVSLVLTSSSHVNLTGVSFPGTTSQTSMLRTVALRVDNSTASTTGTSNIYGVHSYGTAPDIGGLSLWATFVTVRSRGLGTKRGILVNTSAHVFHVRNSNVVVYNLGGSGSYIGCEVNVIGSTLSLIATSISGTTADVSQTAGTLMLGDTLLQNANANGLGFSSIIQSNSFVWADPGGLPTSATRYYRPGTSSVTSTEVFVRISQNSTLKSLNIRALTGPGVGKTDTWTIRKNGVDTSLTVTLSDTQTTNINNNVSVRFLSGDSLSLKIITSSGTSTTDSVIQVDIF